MSSVSAKFDKDGYALVPCVLSHDELAALTHRADAISSDGAGTRRLLGESWCAEAAQALRDNPHLSGILHAGAVAVQCTYFDKSAEHNWLVTLHQDLSIPVKARISDPACVGWSKKEDSLFVQPPVEVLEQMVAVRVHLDDNTPNNGPLRVVPGSHSHGRLSAEQAQEKRLRLGEHECLAPAGSALALRPLILHASSKAKTPTSRRVFHFLFGPPALPYGLGWKHAV
jgi:hypothetical protein